ncbi:MAG: RNA polymerase sigma factor, partial [bacterium]
MYISNSMDKEETKSSDATLVERAINGNKEAFDRLMQKHVPICYQLARRFGLSAEDASDLVQDAFFAAYRSLH